MQGQAEGPSRGSLTFVASREPTESTYFNRLRRVREPVSRSKAGVQGKVADVKHCQRSAKERAGMACLEESRSSSSQRDPDIGTTCHAPSGGNKRDFEPCCRVYVLALLISLGAINHTLK